MRDYDIALDFMDMTQDQRVWTRFADVRPGLDIRVGQHVTVGDDDADTGVARIVAIEGTLIQVEVVPGGLEENRYLLVTP